MAMSVGPAEGDDAELNSTINTTPLVDVMLVLLIIFLITIPVITKTVVQNLPKAVNIPTQTKPENITVEVDAKGNTYWNGKAVPNRAELLELVKTAAVIYTIQRGGVVKVGFITEPPVGSGASAAAATAASTG
jgi:biopolymer transport protein ExbD